MKKLLVVLLVAFALNGFAQQKPLEWHTDVTKAINISVQSGKPLFFFFTGSDWCGWCKQLVKKVFVTPEFATWAAKNVVLVELDFPRRTKLPEATQKQNKELGLMFSVRAYPTVWFVTPEITDGKVNLNKLGNLGTSRDVTVNSWLENANKILKTK
jgi:thioredoxin-related protein